MQGKYPEPQSSKMEGFLHNSFGKMNEKTQKPVFWLVIGIFLFMGLAGYWIGSTFVVQSDSPLSFMDIPVNSSDVSTYLLLEVDDLTLPEPKLNSIWFVHLKTASKPSLGFTPVITKGQAEDDDIVLLEKYPLGTNNLPTHEFLKVLARKGFPTTNYILVDQISIAAFLNWFSGEDLSKPVEITEHSLVEYGKVLRAFCSTLSKPAERATFDFPWSKIVPGHFITSSNFNTTINDLAFLLSPHTPKCEMVPMP